MEPRPARCAPDVEHWLPEARRENLFERLREASQKAEQASSSPFLPQKKQTPPLSNSTRRWLGRGHKAPANADDLDWRVGGDLTVLHLEGPSRAWVQRQALAESRRGARERRREETASRCCGRWKDVVRAVLDHVDREDSRWHSRYAAVAFEDAVEVWLPEPGLQWTRPETEAFEPQDLVPDALGALRRDILAREAAGASDVELAAARRQLAEEEEAESERELEDFARARRTAAEKRVLAAEAPPLATRPTSAISEQECIHTQAGEEEGCHEEEKKKRRRGRGGRGGRERGGRSRRANENA